MKKHRYLILFLFLSFLFDTVGGQTEFPYNPLGPPNSFRSVENPYYWKNRKPFEGYWQQDVHYYINAHIDEGTDIVSGEMQLTYWNNSPDTLREVYFHLYQNAFQPGSYLDQLKKSKGQQPNYGKYESDKKGTEVTFLKSKTANTATSLSWEVDNTIMKVSLDNPIPPGGFMIFEIGFKTYFEDTQESRRMHVINSYGQKIYKGVLWYPRMCVYDRRVGWNKNQHLGREFYGDFGTFDVELSFANDFVVEATGKLQNKSDVMPAELEDRLDIRKFKSKKWGEKPSTIIVREEGKRKIWKYHAENVHDFAFVASPLFRVGKTQWEDVEAISLVQEPHASKWQNAADYSAKTIEVFSKDIGRYGYNKIIVADAEDGMEYPMITLDSDHDPDYRGLLVHEIGHMWFYGMVGSNETYQALLDEGFTQFITVWGLEAIDGKMLVEDEPEGFYRKKFKKPTTARDAEMNTWYHEDVLEGLDPVLKRHSDEFESSFDPPWAYWKVYDKTATMLYNLQYILGDELFLKALRHYFHKWKYCHPFVVDMRTAFCEATGLDLNYFFDQWLETREYTDYRVGKVRKLDGSKYSVSFERKADMQQPIDFVVIDEEGDTANYIIPNTDFVKKADATILPKWHGWDKYNTNYTTEITSPKGIKNIIIDPSDRLPDIYRLDNQLRSKALWSFDHRLRNDADRHHYEWFWRPDLWYNHLDGLKIGGHINGHYMEHWHRFSASFWWNSTLFNKNLTLQDGSEAKAHPFSFMVDYQTPVLDFWKDLDVKLNARWLDGLIGFSAGIQKRIKRKDKFSFSFKTSYRSNESALSYLIHEKEWDKEKWNHQFIATYEHPYSYDFGKGQLNLQLTAPAPLSDFNFSSLSLESISRLNFGEWNAGIRFFAQLGSGNAVPASSALFAYGANPDEMMDNKFTRAAGIFPQSWGGFGSETSHFHFGGGLNLRGYSGYAIIDQVQGKDTSFYKGTSGASLNVEFGRNVIDFRSLRLNLYTFGDFGTIGYFKGISNPHFAALRWDAGFGLALTIKKFWVLEKVKPLTIRLDFPLLLSHTPFSDSDHFQFRWLLGIERAF